MYVIIEDEEDLLSALTDLLELEDLQVVGFTNFFEAQKFIVENQEKVDFVICDNNLKEGLGIELSRDLPPNLGLCIMSGEEVPGLQERDYLEKPFSPDQVFKMLDRHKQKMSS